MKIVGLLLALVWAFASTAGASLAPDPAASLMQEAGERFRQQGASAALPLYLQLVEDHGDDPLAVSARYMVGECHFVVGDFRAARMAFEGCAKKGKKDRYLAEAARVRAAHCLYELGEVRAAREELRELGEDLKSPFLAAESWLGEAISAAHGGRLDRVAAALQELDARRPEDAQHPERQFLSGLLALDRGELQTARQHFSQNGESRGVLMQAWCERQMGRPLDALRSLDRLDEDSRLAAFLQAICLDESGQHLASRSALREILAATSATPEELRPFLRFRLAATELQSGEHRKAAEHFDPKNYPEMLAAPAALLRGNALWLAGDPGGAQAAWAACLRLDPSGRSASAAQHKLVFAHATAQEDLRAVMAAEDFRQQWPGDPLRSRVELLEANSLASLGRDEDAMVRWQSIFDREGEGSLAEQALASMARHCLESGREDYLLTHVQQLAASLLPSESPWRGWTDWSIASAASHNGDHEIASRQFQSFLARYPRHAAAGDALEGLVTSLGELDQPQLARQEQERWQLSLREAQERAGGQTLAAAATALADGDYEAALQEAREFLHEFPGNTQRSRALWMAGLANERLGIPDDALEHWSELVVLAPNSEDAKKAFPALSKLLLDRGEFDQARTTLRQWAQVLPKPDSRRSWGMALCARALDGSDEAIANFQGLLARFPEHPHRPQAESMLEELWAQSGRAPEGLARELPGSELAADHLRREGVAALERGDASRAGELLDQVVRDFPASHSAAPALFHRGASLAAQGNWTEARSTWDALAQHHPEHELAALSRFRAAEAQLQEGDASGAALRFANLAEDGGELAARAWNNAGVAAEEAEDFELAAASYRALLACCPQEPHAQGLWVHLARIEEEELGEFVESIESYQQAMSQGEITTAEFRFRSGRVRERASDTPGAISDYAAAARGSGEHATESLASLARLYEEKGQLALALTHYEELRQRGGESHWRSVAEERIAWLRARGAASTLGENQ